MLRTLLAFWLFIFTLQAQAEILKASDFDADQWKHHPDYSSLATQSDRQFAMHLATSLRYHTLPLLLPAQYRLLTSRQDQKAQAFIDQALSRILKTSAGQNICQQSTNGNVIRIMQVFGVSQNAAQSIRKGCTPATPVQLPAINMRPREYIFIHTADPNGPVEGWTTPHNVSYIFLTDADFNEDFLYRVLAHETAIKLDLKGLWGWTGELTTLSEKLRVRYEGGISCEVQYTIRHPLIKYSLSALRAQVIESQILSEIGLASSNKPASLSCTEQVTSLLPSMARMGALLKYEKSYLNHQIKDCSSGSEMNLAEALQILSKEKVLDLSTRTEMPLCDFLRVPSLSSMAFGPFSGGPRPRIGPWAQKSLVLKGQSAEQKAETLKKMDLLIEDEPKSQSQTDRRLEKLLSPQTDDGPNDRQQKLREDDDSAKN